MKNCFTTALVTSTLALVLSACGGGGGGGSSTTTSTDYVSQYVGTWRSGCYTSAATDTANSASAKAIKDITYTKVSNTQLRASSTEKLYASTDTTCSGAVLATIIITGNNTGSYNASSGTATITSSMGDALLNHDGTKTISSNNVDKFQFTSAPLSTTPANTTIGGVSISSGSSYYTAVSGSKNVLYLNTNATPNTYTLGNRSGALDSNGYPNALSTFALDVWTKQ